MLSGQTNEPSSQDEQIAALLGISVEEWGARLRDSETLPRDRQEREELLAKLQSVSGQ